MSQNFCSKPSYKLQPKNQNYGENREVQFFLSGPIEEDLPWTRGCVLLLFAYYDIRRTENSMISGQVTSTPSYQNCFQAFHQEGKP